MSKAEQYIESLFPKIAIRDCIKELENDTTVDATESMCGHIILEDGREAQVRINITTDRTDFFEPFDIVRIKIQSENKYPFKLDTKRSR